ncbi:DUF4192 family protein [Microbacterium luticocti]|uniref:DUF4192 family protein n=1 Tax=Microbacterium luticocti TaxID=451764 RepID=UPI0004000759|nr:DUF4192 family protein [Microbacterium luticocti]
MSTEPTILRSRTSADLLAILPVLAGHTLSESLVIVPFRGKRTMSVIRLDLQGPDDQAWAEGLAAVAVGMLSRLTECDGAAIAVYTGDTFPVAYAAWDESVRVMGDALEAAGFRVKDALCVAADGYASWYDDEAPFDGHPLSDIDDNPLAAQAAQADGGRALAPHRAVAVLPDPDPALAARLVAAVEDLLVDGVRSDAFGRMMPAELPDGVELVERLLAHEPDAVPFPQLTGLAALAMLPARRDEMTLQIAFGREIGVRARADSDRWHQRCRESGRSMDDEVRCAIDADPAVLHDGPGTLLLGLGDQVPDVDRIRRGIEILRHVVAHLSVDLRPDLLCMLAWLHWAIGEGTPAGIHIDTALRIDPDHRMAQNVRMLIGGGRLPEWIFRMHNDRVATRDARSRSDAASLARRRAHKAERARRRAARR